MVPALLALFGGQGPQVINGQGQAALGPGADTLSGERAALKCNPLALPFEPQLLDNDA